MQESGNEQIPGLTTVQWVFVPEPFRLVTRKPGRTAIFCSLEGFKLRGRGKDLYGNEGFTNKRPDDRRESKNRDEGRFPSCKGLQDGSLASTALSTRGNNGELMNP